MCDCMCVLMCEEVQIGTLEDGDGRNYSEKADIRSI